MQVKHWKEGGHKSSCRPPKDFKSKDIVKVYGVSGRPEINGESFVISGPAEKSGRWLVCSIQEIMKRGLAEAVWNPRTDASSLLSSLPLISLAEDKMRLSMGVEEMNILLNIVNG